MTGGSLAGLPLAFCDVQIVVNGVCVGEAYKNTLTAGLLGQRVFGYAKRAPQGDVERGVCRPVSPSRLLFCAFGVTLKARHDRPFSCAAEMRRPPRAYRRCCSESDKSLQTS